jgi:protein-disulfide isomerase
MTMSNPPPPETSSLPDERLPPARAPARGWVKAAAVASLVLALLAVGLSGAALYAALKLPRAAGQPPDFAAQARVYIESHPEVIVDSLNRADARQKEAEANESATQLAARRGELFNDPAAPVGGNAAGDATLVEFFDYNCPYCRKAAPVLDQLAQADPGVRIVFKEYPILGPGSAFAAKAALAAQKQGKYLPFHNALYASHGSITEASALDVAKNVGLDVDRLKTDMADPAIEKAISDNLALAEALRISGTPTCVTAKRITPGLLGLDVLKQMIAEARKG